MARRDEYADAEDEDVLRTESEGDEAEEGGGAPKNAKERKKAALMPAIASLCSALGGWEDFLDGDVLVKAYSLGDQGVGCLKDLKRFWRLDESDDDRTVARIFFEVGLMKNDLIPILISNVDGDAKGARIALACAELIAAMTWPINVAEELQDAQILGATKLIDYTSLIDAQMVYKSAILRGEVLRPLLSLMQPCLAKNRRDRGEKDENIITLVLNIFRNLAALRDRPEAMARSAQAIEVSTLQSEYIRQLSSEHIFDLLLVIASQADGSEYAPWNMLALDTLHLIFRCVRPDELMASTLDKGDSSRLDNLLQAESKTKLGLSRKSSTRHSRFNSTVSLQVGDRKFIVHKQSATIDVASATKVLDGVKKSKHKKGRLDDDLAAPSNLRPDAIKCLYDFAIGFLDSAFNPFFSSILKDIRMERLKVKETDTIRFLFLSRFFLEFFLLVHRDEAMKGIVPSSDAGHDFDLIAEMTEPASIGFVAGRMKQALEEKRPLWTDLHAGIDCYTQILLVIDALAASGVEDHIDVAEILQNKLYYEGEMLEMVVSVVTKYKNQTLKYLESVITLAHVLQRMLEKYSKSKAYMYVRKKKSKANKKKTKKSATGEDDEGDGIGQGDEENEEEEMERGSRSYADHAFEFSAFELKFAEEGVLDTYMTYLEDWKSLDPEQLKRIVGLMHRQAIKAKSDVLFFKPSVLELFQRIMEDPDIAIPKPRLKEHADLKSLVEYILRKFFKAATENPLLYLDIFYPKSRSQLTKMRIGGDAYSSGDNEAKLRGLRDGEVEVAAGFSLSQQIGIAVGVLVDDEKMHLLDVIKSHLTVAALRRAEEANAVDGARDDGEGLIGNDDAALREKAARLQGPSRAAIETFTPYEVVFEEARNQKAAGVNVHFKLLMRLLKWTFTENEGDDSTHLDWVIPESILPSTLEADVRLIDQFILDPLDASNGKSIRDLLQVQRKKQTKRVRRPVSSDSEAEKGGEENQAEGGKKAKKSRSKKRVAPWSESEGDAAEKRKIRAKKRVEEAAAYKSAQFVADSDDEEDEARDAIFFAAEEALCAQLANGDVSTSKNAAGGPSTQPKKKQKQSKKDVDSDEDSSTHERARKAPTVSKRKKKGQPTPLAPRTERSRSADSIDEEAGLLLEMEKAANEKEKEDEMQLDKDVDEEMTAVTQRHKRVVSDSDDD